MTQRTLANSGKRIVITGMGCVSPLGLDVESTWSAALEGRSGAAKITQFDASGYDVKFACEVKNFNAETYLDKKEMRRMDRFIQLGLVAALQAVEQAGLSTENTSAERIGAYLSSGMGGLSMIERAHEVVRERPDRVSPFFIPAVIPNMISGHLTIMKGFKGPNFGIVSACSTSAHSIGEAMRIIERGDVDAMVVGGAEAAVSPLGVSGFANMKALSSRNDSPETASRPFDKDRDGFVLGEGSAALVLESFENAQRRGAKILGELVGYAANSDANHITSPAEGGEGGARCMKLALRDAGLRPEDVDHINMHGTSTPQGDVAESMAISSVFGAHASKLNCNSTKSMTGHLLGAAGAIEAIFTVLAVERGVIPPTINLKNQDERCPHNYTPLRALSRPIKVGMSNSFGFGGTNATLVVKKFS